MYSRAPGEAGSIARKLADMAYQCMQRGMDPRPLSSFERLADGTWGKPVEVTSAPLRECAASLLEIAKAAEQLEAALEEHAELLRAVEWWQSGDYSPDQVIEALYTVLGKPSPYLMKKEGT